MLGAALGLAVLASVAGSHTATQDPQAAALAARFQAAFLDGAGIVLAAHVSAVLLTQYGTLQPKA